MSRLDEEIQSRIQSFVAELTELAKRSAFEAIAAALGTDGAQAAPRAARTPRERQRSAAEAPTRRARGPRRKGEKRDPQLLETLSNKMLAYVAKNPGKRIEEINRALGTTTKDLALPTRKLVAAGSLKAKGTRRSTTYFVA